jgi:glycosyltransferase involved in cell wall biosynthesis
MGRHWGRPVRHEALAAQMEMTSLQAADLVVAVSDASRDELVGRGIPSDKVLVNPNGVDVDLYSPVIDGREVRARYGLQDRVVMGFIGTFGRWHGAEVLAAAFVKLLLKRPELRDRVALLFIGDGPTLPATRAAVSGVADAVRFCGLVPQLEGPAHLAACDILVSPHVPNPDGSRFFGSPTKLFEYMAMGKPVVASALEQVGTVLDHGTTGWLVEPGNDDRLADGLEALIDDPALRNRLGHNVREVAVARHSWFTHTERIIDALTARCPAS